MSLTQEQLTEITVQVLTGKIEIASLPKEHQDAVIMVAFERAVELIDDTRKGQAYEQIAESLRPSYEAIINKIEEQFEKTIELAIERGLCYTETDSPYLH